MGTTVPNVAPGQGITDSIAIRQGIGLGQKGMSSPISGHLTYRQFAPLGACRIPQSIRRELNPFRDLGCKREQLKRYR
jgi:hypothetical protein